LNDNGSHDRTHHILDLIADTPGLSQRQVASHTGLSLGLVNITLKRLVQTGYIKVSGLNKRKVEYMLTPKGFLEKAERTYSYISRTVRTFKDYQQRLNPLLHELVGDGRRPVVLLGEGELSLLVETALRTQYPTVQFRTAVSQENIKPEELVLDCRFDGNAQPVGVSILSRLLSRSVKGRA
jgi:DNA-binding MarR family transcriptional regulator